MMNIRQEITDNINRVLPSLFTRLTGRKQELKLTYIPSLLGTSAANLEMLEKKAENEIRAGHALYGPHRDDFRLVLAGSHREEYLSQGEYRISLMALKLAMNALIGEKMQFRPVLILDDLFSELDRTVRENLAEHLFEMPNQIFITATEEIAGMQTRGVRIMEINEGRIS